MVRVRAHFWSRLLPTLIYFSLNFISSFTYISVFLVMYSKDRGECPRVHQGELSG